MRLMRRKKSWQVRKEFSTESSNQPSIHICFHSRSQIVCSWIILMSLSHLACTKPLTLHHIRPVFLSQNNDLYYLKTKEKIPFIEKALSSFMMVQLSIQNPVTGTKTQHYLTVNAEIPPAEMFVKLVHKSPPPHLPHTLLPQRKHALFV